MILLEMLTILFIVTSSITTFDKRLIQAKRTGDLPKSEPNLPSWVALIYWIHYGNMIIIFLSNWKYALALFIVGFILEVLPVWEILGNMLMRPFKPKA